MQASALRSDQATLVDSIARARSNTDSLFQQIRTDAIYDRPIAERHRLIFYLGHLEAFDWNQIGRGALQIPSFQPAFDKLFEFGIDPEPGSAPSDQPSDWPGVEEVLAYNHSVRSRLDRVLEHAPAQILNVALEHRLMHAETFAYLMHEMGYDRKVHEAQDWNSGPSPAEEMIDVTGGLVTLGQAPGSFGWDNEFDQHRLSVAPFRIAKYKVTNGEYMDFVNKGGAAPPHFWTNRDDCPMYRGMFECVPLPLDYPVYVTHDEAQAYAAWKGKSLASESQFHRAAYGTPAGSERLYPWGDQAPEPSLGNFDFTRWDPLAVTATPAGDSAFGVSQLAGNGWEWTASEFGPFPGFTPFPFYPGYSQNFFDGRHFVLKGGSPRTAAGLLRRSFRNWFRPNYPYAYATFRLAENG